MEFRKTNIDSITVGGVEYINADSANRMIEKLENDVKTLTTKKEKLKLESLLMAMFINAMFGRNR